MATKIYKLNQPKNSAVFPLYANNGKMKVEYVFKDGNQLMRQPARCTLRNKFYQDLLESSVLFKTRAISLERTIKDDEPEEPKKVEANNPNIVESVKTAEDAVEYVANEWGERVKNGKQAKSYAKRKGIEFPNLVLEEK